MHDAAYVDYYRARKMPVINRHFTRLLKSGAFLIHFLIIWIIYINKFKIAVEELTLQ